jgi:hypothetical protein
MDKLKIGDKVYNIENRRFEELNTYYKIETVVKLTPTQAVLSNGVRLINEGFFNGKVDNGIKFNIFGKRGYWILVNEENIPMLNKNIKEQTAYHWFQTHKFTIADMLKIYNTLNEKNAE